MYENSKLLILILLSGDVPFNLSTNPSPAQTVAGGQTEGQLSAGLTEVASFAGAACSVKGAHLGANGNGSNKNHSNKIKPWLIWFYITYRTKRGIFDHNMTLVVRKLTKQNLRMFINEHNLENTVVSKNKMPQFVNKLNNIDWNDVLQTKDLDNCCNTDKNMQNWLRNMHTSSNASEEESLYPDTKIFTS